MLIRKLCHTHIYTRICKGDGTESTDNIADFACLRVSVATLSMIGLYSIVVHHLAKCKFRMSVAL